MTKRLVLFFLVLFTSVLMAGDQDIFIFYMDGGGDFGLL